VALVSGHGDGRSAYRIVNSCLMPLPLAADQEIFTVESLAANGQLSPAQEAMAAAGGSQCGYCTPGFVMSLFAEHYRPGRDSACDPHALAGNLCRCTGYRPIRDATLSLGAPPEGVFKDRLARPAPRISALSLPGYSRPGTVDECVAILAADPQATLIAGGTDLGVEKNLGGRRWSHLVSLDAIDELRACADTRDAVTLGAALPLADIPRRWPAAPGFVREWLELFASPLIRNRATLGGNLMTASPIGDAAPLLLALDANVHVAGSGGRRAIPMSSFFAGYRKTSMRPGEIIVAIEIPKPWPAFVRFYKVAKRRMDDISTVAVAIGMDWDGGTRVSRSRFAFGGVAATPVRVVEAENAATGQIWNEATVERVRAIIGRSLTPMSDHRGSKEYRLAVSQSLIGKFLAEYA
jgi:xanthine dehydrogenase small subunit